MFHNLIDRRLDVIVTSGRSDVMPQLLNPKTDAYAQLVADRKCCSACAGLTNPSKYKNLDSDRIGPYTRWQGNLDAELVVVAQDSCDVNKFVHGGGDWPGEFVPTNLTLVQLVKAAGIKITPPRRDYSEDRLLFYKRSFECLDRVASVLGERTHEHLSGALP